MKKLIATALILMAWAGLTGCRPAPAPSPTVAPSSTIPSSPTALPSPTTSPEPVEQAVIEISLAGPVADANAEVSGLAWSGDHLILLPQYPERFGNVLFALPRSEIVAFLDGEHAGPLEPVAVPFSAEGIRTQISGYEGYEAIGFSGDRVYLTIEASGRGYLVAGTVAPDLSGIVLEPALVELPGQSGSTNKSDEALIVLDDTVITLYEVNGAALNPAPVARQFDLDLNPLGTLPFPNVEYRITDASVPDGAGRFWAINYFYPGDTDLLPEIDPLTERYGLGPSHAAHMQVERLAQFEVGPSGIVLVDTPPIQLALTDEARNWEGLVTLDGRGFLLATDKFPGTVLAFISLP